MLDAGRLECASATSIALTDEGQRRLFADVERYAEDVVLRPADVSNHPGLIDVFVTERGVADVRGCSPVERAERIIDECAHPSFEPRLREYLDDVRHQRNHIPHDVERAAEWYE